MSERHHVSWQQQHVVDVRDAAFAARTYLEQRDLRSLLSAAIGTTRLNRGCEFGSGFGRMTPVLSEFASVVCGFEREPTFVDEASRLFPDIAFARVSTLEHVPADDASFDLVVTFTVLQHLVDAVLAGVAAEIDRVLRPGGLLVLCEETDPAHRTGDVLDPRGVCTIGRTVATYAAQFKTLTLVETRPRVIEPTYARPDVGTYMVFRKHANRAGSASLV